MYIEQTNLVLNAVKNAGGNNFAIICDGSRVNQELFKMFNGTLMQI